MTTTANPDELLEAAAAFVAKVESYNIQVDGECFCCDWFEEDDPHHGLVCPYLRLKVAVGAAQAEAAIQLFLAKEGVALPSIEEMSGLIADWDQGAAPNTRP